MQKEVFKAGDKVYCPRHGNKIYTITKNFNYNSTPIKVLNYDLKENGCFLGKSNKIPQVFHVNEKNKELLELLYGVEFETLIGQGINTVNGETITKLEPYK